MHKLSTYVVVTYFPYLFLHTSLVSGLILEKIKIRNSVQVPILKIRSISGLVWFGTDNSHPPNWVLTPTLVLDSGSPNFKQVLNQVWFGNWSRVCVFPLSQHTVPKIGDSVDINIVQF
jgi:hypothetical protein